MKLLSLTVGAAPFLLLPTLFGSPLQQSTTAHDDCAQEPCETRAVAVCEPVCESHSENQASSATTCERAQTPHATVARVAARTLAPVATVASSSPAHVHGQHVEHPVVEEPAEYESVMTLRALLQGEAVDPGDEEIVFDFDVEGSHDGVTRWVRISSTEPEANFFVLDDVTNQPTLHDVTNSSSVQVSLEQAIETFTESLRSEELRALTQKMDEPGGLRENLNEALDALYKIVGHDSSFDRVVTHKTAQKGSGPVPQTRSGWSASAPHIVVLKPGTAQTELHAIPDSDGAIRVLARVLDEHGTHVDLNGDVFEYGHVTSVTPVPTPPAAPKPAPRRAAAAAQAPDAPHRIRLRSAPPRAPQSSPATSEIAQILNEMRAEMREMRASMAELRAQLTKDRAGAQNSQRRSPGGMR